MVIICSLMMELEMFEKVIEEGKEGKLNEYLLFYN
jgi:hypothetical protein